MEKVRLEKKNERISVTSGEVRGVCVYTIKNAGERGTERARNHKRRKKRITLSISVQEKKKRKKEKKKKKLRPHPTHTRPYDKNTISLSRLTSGSSISFASNNILPRVCIVGFALDFRGRGVAVGTPTVGGARYMVGVTGDVGDAGELDKKLSERRDAESASVAGTRMLARGRTCVLSWKGRGWILVAV